jgi:SpoVK/Ycf46/Vps4 family AAA+-type ATPase
MTTLIEIPQEFIEINYNSADAARVMKHILRYAITLDNSIKSYNSSGYSKSKEASRYDDEIDYDIDLSLTYGITRILHKENDIYFNYIQEDFTIGTSDHATKYETLKLYGKNKEVLTKFLEDSRQYNININKNNKIVCRILQGSSWTVLNTMNPRSAETLFLDFDINTIYDNIQEFLDSEQEYNNHGKPFKLNYLLHGTPGSGKTSIINTIASKFNMDICFLVITKELEDYTFTRALTNIPSNSLLVIEDIDSLFSDRDSKYSLSFSTVLNVLDGALKKHKLITFLTTNYKKNIDQALFRSGRIDYQIEFGPIKKKQIKEMYDYFFKNQNEHFPVLMEALKSKKMCCADFHHWCFQHRKSDNVLQYIDELLENIKNESDCNEHMYI